jgi:brefeldin A-inhibited guanine nucleotide-exchange protein
MLNTDQHNPQVKKRMEVSDFIKNNRGINEGQNLPESILRGIFEDISTNEIKLKDHKKQDDVDDVKILIKPKKNGDRVETPKINLHSTIKQYNGATRDLSTLDDYFKPAEPKEFVEANHFGHIKPMFHIVWMSCLISVSSFLQNSGDINSTKVCLEGFKNAIHICSVSNLQLEMKAFLTNLRKYVDLGPLVDLREKNIEACKTIIDIAINDGESFRGHWDPVVKCLSELERLQSIGLTQPDQSRFLFLIRSLEQRKLDYEHIEEMFALVCSQSITLSVDKIFTQSAKLSIEPVCEFAKSLCNMSWDEIISSSSRVFIN